MQRSTTFARTVTFLLSLLGAGGVVTHAARKSPVPIDRTIHVVVSALESASDLRDGGPYRGFDTYTYPGDSTMRVWRDAGDYQWVGYYLPAPCHSDSSWSGTRARLEQMGWGTAVIYVGQQTWGKSKSRPSRSLGGVSTCRANLVTASRGTMDADDAIARAHADGFAKGTVIFLDIEHMNVIPPSMRDYYRAWTTRVLADGQYRPGYYAHTANAETIYGDVANVFAAAGSTDKPQFWVAGGREFSPDKWPQDVGHVFAAAWQGVLDVRQSVGGVTLPIDVSVGDLPSPSATMVAVE